MVTPDPKSGVKAIYSQDSDHHDVTDAKADPGLCAHSAVMAVFWALAALLAPRAVTTQSYHWG